MLTPGDRVLVAVSGGPDSVALLAALAVLAPRLSVELCAAHLNHQLRGSESWRDQACAEAVAQRLGIACVVGSRAGRLAGPNLEARAREQRYAFLAEVATARSCTKIATGHTSDDQAETLLLRLLRGSGLDGLTGIQAVRDWHIIRPMIECSRQQVLAFLEAEQLPFCEDSSNRDPRFLRNRVRHEVLPVLRMINPAVAPRLASAATVIAAESAWLDDHLGSWLGAATGKGGRLSVVGLLAVPVALRGRAVRLWLRSRRGNLRRLTAAHVHAIIELAGAVRPNACVALPGGAAVVREYDQLSVAPHPVAIRSPELGRLLVPGAAVELESGWVVSAHVVGHRESERPADLWTMVADADAVPGPLLIRHARPGDRIQPLGMAGHRKLQDVFVDRKLPVSRRRDCAVVEADGEILWVPGVVRSAAALITARTRVTLWLRAYGTAIAGQ